MSLFYRAAAMAALLAIAACAPPRAAPTRATEQAGSSVGVGYGTIVAIRPAAQAVENDGVATILLAIGDAAERKPARGQPAEFIVHEDFNLAPLSVVQADVGTFRAGDRVVILRGDRTRLARGAPPAPTGS